MSVQYSAATGVKCLRIENVSSTVAYFGYAVPGTSESDETWRIMKMTQLGDVTKIEYPNGTTSTNFSWTNRNTYSYS